MEARQRHDDSVPVTEDAGVEKGRPQTHVSTGRRWLVSWRARTDHWTPAGAVVNRVQQTHCTVGQWRRTTDVNLHINASSMSSNTINVVQTDVFQVIDTHGGVMAQKVRHWTSDLELAGSIPRRSAVTQQPSFTNTCVSVYQAVWIDTSQQRWCSEAGKVTVGLAESNGSLLLDLWLTSPVGCLTRKLEIWPVYGPEDYLYLYLEAHTKFHRFGSHILIDLCRTNGSTAEKITSPLAAKLVISQMTKRCKYLLKETNDQPIIFFSESTIICK